MSVVQLVHDVLDFVICQIIEAFALWQILADQSVSIFVQPTLSGRAFWRELTGYHRRSCVESKMHCVKLLGQSLMARDFDRQVAEIQIRVAALNRYTALGIPVTETVG